MTPTPRHASQHRHTKLFALARRCSARSLRTRHGELGIGARARVRNELSPTVGHESAMGTKCHQALSVITMPRKESGWTVLPVDLGGCRAIIDMLGFLPLVADYRSAGDVAFRHSSASPPTLDGRRNTCAYASSPPISPLSPSSTTQRAPRRSRQRRQPELRATQALSLTFTRRPASYGVLFPGLFGEAPAAYRAALPASSAILYILFGRRGIKSPSATSRCRQHHQPRARRQPSRRPFRFERGDMHFGRPRALLPAACRHFLVLWKADANDTGPSRRLLRGAPRPRPYSRQFLIFSAHSACCFMLGRPATSMPAYEMRAAGAPDDDGHALGLFAVYFC